uniref:Neurohypophysial hormone n=1 Tax=Pithovirus LCDPAC01 TaxID=2506600 RepID=A0A4D5XEL2_9VIRU|nr:MAG: neurohypophysial hormone [Pithovirus LCDPAC01]
MGTGTSSLITGTVERKVDISNGDIARAHFFTWDGVHTFSIDGGGIKWGTLTVVPSVSHTNLVELEIVRFGEYKSGQTWLSRIMIINADTSLGLAEEYKTDQELIDVITGNDPRLDNNGNVHTLVMYTKLINKDISEYGTTDAVKRASAISFFKTVTAVKHRLSYSRFTYNIATDELTNVVFSDDRTDINYLDLAPEIDLKIPTTTVYTARVVHDVDPPTENFFIWIASETTKDTIFSWVTSWGDHHDPDPEPDPKPCNPACLSGQKCDTKTGKCVMDTDVIRHCKEPCSEEGKMCDTTSGNCIDIPKTPTHLQWWFWVLMAIILLIVIFVISLGIYKLRKRS